VTKRPAAANAAGKQRVRGRPFVKGSSGNPVGKKPGTRNHATVIVEALMAGDIEAVVNKVVRKAKGGDMSAARLVLDRVAPPRRGRIVRFPLPVIQCAADVVHALGAISAAVGRGEITSDEALQLSTVVEVTLRAIETAELEARVAMLEQKAQTHE
jgi:hypothetical protein